MTEDKDSAPNLVRDTQWLLERHQRFLRLSGRIAILLATAVSVLLFWSQSTRAYFVAALDLQDVPQVQNVAVILFAVGAVALFFKATNLVAESRDQRRHRDETARSMAEVYDEVRRAELALHVASRGPQVEQERSSYGR